LLDGPINSTNSVERAGVMAFSQRAGELEHMGYVVRSRVTVSATSAPVVQATITEKGREKARALLAMREVGAGSAVQSGRRAAPPDYDPACGTSGLFPPGPEIHDGRKAVRS
jgi:hypothetical protein